MVDITLLGLVSGRNKGEALLIDMASAFVSGSMPDKALSDRFVSAVRAMMKEDDQAQRADIFMRNIGMVNPPGRPSLGMDWRKREQEQNIALDYWLRRLQGDTKTQALRTVAEDWQRSGECPEGYPAPRTVRRIVNLHPKQGVRAWVFNDIIKPPKEWAAKVQAEIQEKVTKTP